uniref:Putative reverse transcriptase, RNA-dependent DNA polymerase, Gag-polypeptide of LTR copia-type n=1 Tax=Tanacetum cinerariifolium TaxID=118510 RepID=A0A6L2P118_TANCI|nr:putative reverse transcriptase, RNA-dependent DNA polymerase, Gag-polypeptide of LTR copia-type [Tanacetum cinerariifolium]
MKFLMGFDDVYQPIRNSLLTREILPEVKDAFVIIAREESHRGISLSFVKSKKPPVSAFVLKSNDNNKNGIILVGTITVVMKLMSLLNEKTCPFVQDTMVGFKKGEVMGTGSEFGGLYVFDKEYNKCVFVNQSFLPFLSGKSPFFLVYGREPKLSLLRSFGCLCYAAIVKGCDKFSGSKKHATFLKSLAKAKYKEMASATCEVMWILKILKDLGLDGLVPIILFCENKFAIQIDDQDNCGIRTEKMRKNGILDKTQQKPHSERNYDIVGPLSLRRS